MPTTQKLLIVCLAALLFIHLITSWHNARVITALENDLIELKLGREREIRDEVLRTLDSLRRIDYSLIRSIDSLNSFYEDNPVTFPDSTFDFLQWATDRYGEQPR